MTLLDASVLFGTIDRRGENLARARRALASSPRPFFATEACLAEAMLLAGSRVGWIGQDRIWKIVEEYRVELLKTDLSRVQRLMRRDQDVPMDFADATLVVLASEDDRLRIATFDQDFLAYRRDDGSPVPLVGDRLLGWD